MLYKAIKACISILLILAAGGCQVMYKAQSLNAPPAGVKVEAPSEWK